MLPSSTNRNSTYVIYFYVYFYEARIAIPIILNPFCLHIAIRYYLFFPPQI